MGAKQRIEQLSTTGVEAGSRARCLFTLELQCHRLPRSVTAGQFRWRMERTTLLLLELLECYGARVTFFIESSYAERSAFLVKAIYARGHEVACYGNGGLVHESGFKQFSEQLRKSREFLEDLTGAPVFGYRAHDFSLTKTTLWVLELLASYGFRFDSSIYPVLNPNRGVADWPSRPVLVQTAAGGLVEIPAWTFSWAGLHFPCAGGRGLRLVPLRLLLGALESSWRGGNLPAALYFRGEELDEKISPNGAAAASNRLRLLLSRYATFTAGELAERVCRTGPNADITLRSWGVGEPKTLSAGAS